MLDFASHSHEVRNPTPRRLGPPTRQSPLLPKPSPTRPIWPIVSASASSTASSRQSRPMDTDLLCPYAGVQIANLLTRLLQQARPCRRCDTNADASGQIQLRQGRKRHDNNCSVEQYSDDGVGAQVVTTCRRQAGAWPVLRPARPCANAPVSGARTGRNRLNDHRCCVASARLAVCGVKTS